MKDYGSLKILFSFLAVLLIIYVLTCICNKKTMRERFEGHEDEENQEEFKNSISYFF